MSQRAIITGGANGIGLALAKRCVTEAMQVILLDNDAPALAEAKKNLDAVTYHVDLSDLTAVAATAVRFDHDMHLAWKALWQLGLAPVSDIVHSKSRRV